MSDESLHSSSTESEMKSDFPHPLDDSNWGDTKEEEASEIVAELASDSFQFGIKSMAAVMIAPAAIFGLISYFGALIGLVIGLLLAISVLTILFFVAVIRHGSVSVQANRQFNGWTVLLVLACTVLFFAVAFAGGGKAAVYFLNDISLGNKYASELGFTYEVERFTQTTNSGMLEIRAVRVTSVSPGGEFERAGFQENDVIADYSFNEIFRVFERERGERLTLNVCSEVSDSMMSDLSKANQREIEVFIPE